MRANNRLLYRTARSIMRDDCEAEEVLQDAYVKAYAAMKHFKAQSKLSTWLVRIVINEALGRRRKFAPEQIAVDNVVHLEQLIERTSLAAQSPSTPEQLAMRADLRRLIQAHVDRLPPHFRSVFVLRAIEELSVEETAQCLGIAQITVRTRFLRARRLLREHAARELKIAFDGAFAFAGARCDRMVAGVLARVRALPPPET
jgi:RNA polymerase sigma-70 factor, ECF subfamily